MNTTQIKTRRIPTQYENYHIDASFGLEVWMSEDATKVIGFKGKSIKANFHYVFKKAGEARNYADEFIASVNKAHAEKLSAKNNLERKLEVGDLLVSSWGYDQTNIDYYQVISLVGKSSVSIRQINKTKKIQNNNSMVGTCLPVPNDFLSGEFTRRVIYDGLSVKIAGNYCSARKKEYQEINGARIYSEDNWTAYA